MEKKKEFPNIIFFIIGFCWVFVAVLKESWLWGLGALLFLVVALLRDKKKKEK